MSRTIQIPSIKNFDETTTFSKIHDAILQLLKAKDKTDIGLGKLLFLMKMTKKWKTEKPEYKKWSEFVTKQYDISHSYSRHLIYAHKMAHIINKPENVDKYHNYSLLEKKHQARFLTNKDGINDLLEEKSF